MQTFSTFFIRRVIFLFFLLEKFSLSLNLKITISEKTPLIGDKSPATLDDDGDMTNTNHVKDNETKVEVVAKTKMQQLIWTQLTFICFSI